MVLYFQGRMWRKRWSAVHQHALVPVQSMYVRMYCTYVKWGAHKQRTHHTFGLANVMSGPITVNHVYPGLLSLATRPVLLELLSVSGPSQPSQPPAKPPAANHHEPHTYTLALLPSFLPYIQYSTVWYTTVLSVVNLSYPKITLPCPTY